MIEQQKELGFTSLVENTRYQTLKLIQEGLCISQIAKVRGVSRTSVYKVIATLNKKGLISHTGHGTYVLKDKAYQEFKLIPIIEQRSKIVEPKIARVRTELNFIGDIRELKSFVLKRANLFIRPAIKEWHRDIPLKIKRKIIQQSNGKCRICGDNGNEIHHIEPYCIGGKHELTNLELLCKRCHELKSKDIKKIIITSSNKEKFKE
jgi:DNA-binding transcriptional ArsR family regulator